VTEPAPSFPIDQLLEALEVAVVVFDREGTVLFTNRRARDAFAVFGDPAGKLSDLFDHGLEVFDQHGVMAPRLLTSERAHRTEADDLDDLDGVVLGTRAPGRRGVVWVSVTTRPLRGDDGEVVGVVCSFTDVTEQRNVERALQESEARFRALAESAADVVYRFSVGDSPHFDYVNPAVETHLGYLPQDFYDDPSLILRVTHPDDVEIVRGLGFEGCADAQSIQIRMIRRDGTQIWTEHRIAPLRDDTGMVIAAAGVARDVTASKVKEALLSHRALHDALTGLPNRVLLLDRLEAALARLRRHHSQLAVLYLDLDRFKTVNDNLGHDVGDRLLQVVAQRLQQTLRPSDSVARLGGDEFAAVLADLHDPSEAMQVAQRLLTVIAEPVDLGDSALVTTVSIGIASTHDGEASAGELLRRADFAMYTAKDNGRARAECYDTPALGDGAP
jgi:diguanylate cyclase (GGDEF)-like protein/PAS domain S-box-containing protein